MPKNTKILFVAVVTTVFAVGLIALQTDVTAFETTDRTSSYTAYEKTTSTDLERMQEIVNMLENGEISDGTRMTLSNEAEQLRQKAISESTMTEEKRIELESQMEKLREASVEDPGFNMLMRTEIVGYGIDEEKGTIFFDIEPDFATESNAQKYKAKFAEIIDGEDDLTLKPLSRAAIAGCTGLSANCDPLIGAIKVEADNANPCSIGFQAKIGSTEGFIMSGHCGDDNDDVHQPYEFFDWNKVGTITEDATDGDTKCDCAFVDTTGTNSVDDVIHSDIAVDSVGSIVYNDYISMRGYSGGTTTGQIKTTAYDTWISGSGWLRDHFRVDDTVNLGDSGGPAYESGATYPDLMGIVSSVQGSYTIVSKASNLDDEISGASFDFT